MKKLFLLIKEDIDFSKEEILSLYKPTDYDHIEDLLIFDTDKDLSHRIALTKKIYDVIETSKDIISSVQKIEWNNIIKGSYKVRCDDNRLEKKIANKIHEKLAFPKVDLKNPDNFIQIFLRNQDFYICILRNTISTDWKERKPHLKPQLSPTSLNPRIAIAMINLSGFENGILCDPFCGTGGILVEAGLMNFKTIGFDIDEICINKAKINLDNYNIKNYDLINDNALKNNKRFDFVVTDLPYGLNTKINESIENIYEKFFNTYYNLCETMIVGLPADIDAQKYLNKWRIKKEFTIYLHKSLSKKILKLSKN